MRGAVLIVAFIPLCGCAAQQAYHPVPFANMHVTYMVHLQQAQVQPFINALRDNVQVRSVQLNVNEIRNTENGVYAAGSDVYQTAFDDAHRKAEAIAERAGKRLDQVISVAEYSEGESAQPTTQIVRSVNVVTVSERVVTLAVDYAAQPGGTIAVFGHADTARGAPDGVSVDIFANGANDGQVRDRIRQAESDVASTAASFHTPQSDLIVTGAGFTGE